MYHLLRNVEFNMFQLSQWAQGHQKRLSKLCAYTMWGSNKKLFWQTSVHLQLTHQQQKGWVIDEHWEPRICRVHVGMSAHQFCKIIILGATQLKNTARVVINSLQLAGFINKILSVPQFKSWNFYTWSTFIISRMIREWTKEAKEFLKILVTEKKKNSNPV